jgi:hypothetical protein
MARLWEQARRILSQQGAPGSRGLDRGFCIVQLKASANLRSISVRQPSTTLIAVRLVFSRHRSPARSVAIGVRRAAALPRRRATGERQETTAARKRQDHASRPAIQDVII